MKREIKLQFIIDNKHITRAYTINEMLERGITHEHILEDTEGPCTCSLNESTSHCEGDCCKFDESEITGTRLFTGLKDRNGVEIFENDRVKVWRRPAPDYDCNGTVVFKDGGFYIIFDEHFPNRNELNLWVNDMQLIGTIYDK